MEECRDGEDTGRGGEGGGVLRIVRGSWYDTDCHLLCISLFSFYEKSFSLKWFIVRDYLDFFKPLHHFIDCTCIQ